MIPVEFYKHGGETIQNSILAVFNFVHQSGDYPQAWAEGIINPVHKAGKTSEPEKLQENNTADVTRKVIRLGFKQSVMFYKGSP